MSSNMSVRALLMLGGLAAQLSAAPFVSGDYLKLRSVGAVALSPDGKRIAYTVESQDRPGKRYSQIWIVTIADGKSTLLGDANGQASEPTWSPDGRLIALTSKAGDASALMVGN